MQYFFLFSFLMKNTYAAVAAFNQLIETQPELAEEIADELNWHPPYGKDSLSVKLKNNLILCAMHKAHIE